MIGSARSILVSILLIGCIVPPKYYSVHYTETRRELVPPRQLVDKPSPYAQARMANAKLIAFAPPDSCMDLRTEAERTETQVDVARIRCGAIMSELESAAMAAGFEVVSWQALRSESAHVHAKAVDVDLIIEVNEFSFANLTTDLYMKHQGAFFHLTEQDGKQSVRLPGIASIAKRCIDRFTNDKANAAAFVVLDLKVVEAKTGKALWRYAPRAGYEQSATQNETRLYRADGKYVTNFKWLIYGLIVSAVGGAMLSSEDAPLGEQAVSLLLTGAGLGLTGAALYRVVVPQYEPPESVVCMEDHLVPTTHGSGFDNTALSSRASSFEVDREEIASEASSPQSRIRRNAHDFLVVLRSASEVWEDSQTNKEAKTLFWRGQNQLRQNLLLEAEDTFRKLTELVPHAPVPHLMLGRILEAQNRCDEALTHFTRYRKNASKRDFAELADALVSLCKEKVKATGATEGE